MVSAVWRQAVLASSDNTVVIEGNHYFPPADVNREYLVESDYRSTCPWKGEAHYYHIIVNSEKNINGAWYYPEPKEKARHIAGFVAFWKDVEVEG